MDRNMMRPHASHRPELDRYDDSNRIHPNFRQYEENNYIPAERSMTRDRFDGNSAQFNSYPSRPQVPQTLPDSRSDTYRPVARPSGSYQTNRSEDMHPNRVARGQNTEHAGARLTERYNVRDPNFEHQPTNASRQRYDPLPRPPHEFIEAERFDQAKSFVGEQYDNNFRVTNQPFLEMGVGMTASNTKEDDKMSLCSDTSDPDKFASEPVMVFDYGHKGAAMTDKLDTQRDMATVISRTDEQMNRQDIGVGMDFDSTVNLGSMSVMRPAVHYDDKMYGRGTDHRTAHQAGHNLSQGGLIPSSQQQSVYIDKATSQTAKKKTSIPSLLDVVTKKPTSLTIQNDKPSAKKSKPFVKQQHRQQQQQPAKNEDNEDDPEYVQAHLFIGNLPTDITEKQIKDFLITYNPQVWIAERKKDRSDVCAFVKAYSLRVAKDLKKKYSGISFKGKTLLVRLAAAYDFEAFDVRRKDSQSKNVKQQPVAETVQQMRNFLQQSSFSADTSKRRKLDPNATATLISDRTGDLKKSQGHEKYTADEKRRQLLRLTELGFVAEDGVTLICKTCELTFLNEKNLHQHLDGAKHKALTGLSSLAEVGFVAGDGLTLMCKTCDMTFNGEIQLAQHLRGIRHLKNKEASEQPPPAVPSKLENNPGWKVDFAKEERKKLIEDGVITISNGEFACNKCDMFFNAERQLVEHLGGVKHKTKSEKPPILQQSDIPGLPNWRVSLSEEDRKKLIDEGIITIAGDIVGCKKCEMFFNGERQLVEHLGGIRHKSVCETGLAPAVVSLFTCQICDMAFNGEKQLSQHLGGIRHEKNVLQAKNEGSMKSQTPDAVAYSKTNITSVKVSPNLKRTELSSGSHHEQQSAQLLGKQERFGNYSLSSVNRELGVFSTAVPSHTNKDTNRLFGSSNRGQGTSATSKQALTGSDKNVHMPLGRESKDTFTASQAHTDRDTHRPLPPWKPLTYSSTTQKTGTGSRKSSSETNKSPVGKVLSSRLLEKLKDGTKSVLGIRYVTEYRSPDGCVAAFTCSLCYTSVYQVDILSHMTSYKHCYTYLKLENPELRQKVDNLTNQADRSNMVRSLAQQLPDADKDVTVVTTTSPAMVQTLQQLSMRVMTLKIHQPIGSLVATLIEAQIDRIIIDFHKQSPMAPLVGLRYLLEVINKAAFVKSIFLCQCCDETLSKDNVMLHMTSFNHITNYFYAEHKEMLNILCRADITDKDFRDQCLECAKSIEGKEGWDQVLCVTQEEFKLMNPNRDLDLLKPVRFVLDRSVSQLKKKVFPDIVIKTEKYSEKATDDYSNAEYNRRSNILPEDDSQFLMDENLEEFLMDENLEGDVSPTGDDQFYLDDSIEDFVPKESGHSGSAEGRQGNATQPVVGQFDMAGKQNHGLKAEEHFGATGKSKDHMSKPKGQFAVADGKEQGIKPVGSQSVLSVYLKENNMTQKILGLSHITEVQCDDGIAQYRCDLCALGRDSLSSTRSLASHVTSHRHRMAYLRYYHRKEWGQINSKPSKVARLECQRLCDVALKNDHQGQMTIKVSPKSVPNKRLKKNSAQRSTMEEITGQSKRPREEAGIDKGLDNITFYKLLKGNEVLTGLNYVTEVQESATNHTVLKYNCTLCDYTCSKQYIITHLQGLVHRNKFLETNYPMLLKKTGGQIKKTHEFSKDIQAQFGREPINVSWQISTDSRGEPVFSTPISSKSYFDEKGTEPNQKKLKLMTPEAAKTPAAEKRTPVFELICSVTPKQRMLGLQYVTEVQHPTTKVVCYECSLCRLKGPDLALSVRSVIRHITTTGHRLNFFRETHYDIFEKISGAKKISERNKLLDTYTTEVESRIGRGQVMMKQETEEFWSKRLLHERDSADIVRDFSQSGNRGTASTSTAARPVGKKDAQLVVKDTKTVTKNTESIVKNKQDAESRVVIGDQITRVSVCHVTSPSNFYVRVLSRQSALDRLSQDIQKFCRSNNAESASKLTGGGEKVLARSSQDGRWHRAFVAYVDPLHPDTKVTVRYIDIGTEEVISSDHYRMRRMTGSFSQDPPYALRCCMASIVPKDKKESWPMEARQTFTALVKDKEMDMKLVKEENNVRFVDLFKCGQRFNSIQTILKRQNHAMLGSPDTKLIFSDIAPRKAKPFVSEKVRQIIHQRKTPADVWQRSNSRLERRLENGEVKISNRPSKFLKSITGLNLEGQLFAGLDHVTEVQDEAETVEPWYMCKLCEERIDWKNIFSHVSSMKHKILYIEQRDMEMFWLINRTKVLIPLIDNLVKELHTKHGGLPSELNVWLLPDDRADRVVKDAPSSRPAREVSPGRSKSRSGRETEHGKRKTSTERVSDSKRNQRDLEKKGLGQKEVTGDSKRSAATVKSGPSKRTDEQEFKSQPDCAKPGGASKTPVIDLTCDSEKEESILEGSVDDDVIEGMSDFEFEVLEDASGASDDENHVVIVSEAIKPQVKQENTAKDDIATTSKSANDKSEPIQVADVMTYVNKSCYGVGAKKPVNEGGVVRVDDDTEDKVKEKNTMEKLAKVKKPAQEVIVSVSIGIDSKDETNEVERVGLELTSVNGKNDVIESDIEIESEDADAISFDDMMEWAVVDEVGEEDEKAGFEIDKASNKTDNAKPEAGQKDNTDVVNSIRQDKNSVGESGYKQTAGNEDKMSADVGPSAEKKDMSSPIKKQKQLDHKEDKPAGGSSMSGPIKTEVTVDVGDSGLMSESPRTSNQREGEISVSVGMTTQKDGSSCGDGTMAKMEVKPSQVLNLTAAKPSGSTSKAGQTEMEVTVNAQPGGTSVSRTMATRSRGDISASSSATQTKQSNQTVGPGNKGDNFGGTKQLRSSGSAQPTKQKNSDGNQKAANSPNKGANKAQRGKGGSAHQQGSKNAPASTKKKQSKGKSGQKTQPKGQPAASKKQQKSKANPPKSLKKANKKSEKCEIVVVID